MRYSSAKKRRWKLFLLNTFLQTLAIKFGNEANSQKFFEAFEEMRKYVLKVEAKRIQEEEARTNVCPAAAEGGDNSAPSEDTGVAEQMSALTVTEK